MIWRWWWLLVLGVVVAVGSTYLAVRDQPPMYQAKARLMVGQAINEQQPNSNDIWTAQNLAQTYQEIAQGTAIRKAAQEALGLPWLPGYTVSQVANTQLLDVQVIDTDPQRAAAVANEVANQLAVQSPAGSKSEQAQHQDFVRQQLKNLEANINATQAEIDKLTEELGQMFSAREIADTHYQITALQQKLNV